MRDAYVPHGEETLVEVPQLGVQLQQREETEVPQVPVQRVSPVLTAGLHSSIWNY